MMQSGMTSKAGQGLEPFVLLASPSGQSLRPVFEYSVGQALGNDVVSAAMA